MVKFERLPLCSLVVQKWCSFTVLTDNCTFLSNTSVLSKYLWSSDHNGTNEENTSNDKGKDPLEGDNVGFELSNGKSW